MGNSLRCCLSCVLPCGALDLIRIIHLSQNGGTLEEITHSVIAGDILKANPNHVLAMPFSKHGVDREIILISPDSDLKRGTIYFLIPTSSLPHAPKAPDSDTKKKMNHKNKDSSSNDHDHRRNRKLARVPVEWHPYLDSILEE